MSISRLESLLEEDPDLPTTLSDDCLNYLHYVSSDEFMIFEALDLRFLQEWLKTYPTKATLRLGLIANGEIEPLIGEVVEILELMEKTLAKANPENPWTYRFRCSPPVDAEGRNDQLWLYDEDNADVIFAGRFEEGYNMETNQPTECFFNENGEFALVSHWALRKAGESAPAAPPVM